MKRLNSAENTKWWRTAEVDKAEMSFRAYFTVKHGRDFARTVMRVAAQSVARGDRLRQPQINIFE